MNVAGSLTLVADPMVWNGRTIQQSKNEFVNTHGNTENVAYSTLQAVTTKCGNEVILKSLEENRKTALTNVLRQINEMESLLSSVNNEEIVRVNVLQLNRLFMNMQSAHQLYINQPENERDIASGQNWYDIQDKRVFEFKKQITEFLNNTKEEKPIRYETYSCKSERSRQSRSSVASSTSTRTELIVAKTKVTAQEMKAAFLKEKQALRMAAEELEFKE